MELRKTKIVCTVGPAIDSEKMLIKMFNAGMNVARLNFSHGSYEEAIKRIARIKTASAKTNKYIGILYLLFNSYKPSNTLSLNKNDLDTYE